MKDKWIKVTDALPKLEYISNTWESSELVLCTNGEDVFTAFYQGIAGKYRWDGYQNYDNVTHWQLIELP
jgi:hypothetical protein